MAKTSHPGALGAGISLGPHLGADGADAPVPRNMKDGRNVLEQRQDKWRELTQKKADVNDVRAKITNRAPQAGKRRRICDLDQAAGQESKPRHT